MAISTIDSFDFSLKELYPSGGTIVQTLTLKGHPFFSEVTKDTDFSGEPYPLPHVFSDPQGLGAEFNVAQGNQTNTDGDAWQIRLGDYFGFVTIGDKIMKISRNNLGAFIKNKTAEINGLYTRFGQDYSLQLWGNGGGRYGAVATSGISGEVITLANKLDAYNFSKNMYIQASSGDGTSVSHVLNEAGAQAQIASVNIGQGKITLKPGGVAALSLLDGDSLFRAGNFAGPNVKKLISGVQAWIPASDPGSTAFFSVDRTQSLTELSGVRPQDQNGPLEERLQRLLEEVNTFQGGIPDCVYVHPRQWRKLSISLQNKGYRPLEKMLGNFGYKSLEIDSHTGTADVYGDRHVPENVGFALDMSSWVLTSALETPHVFNGDGLEMLRSSAQAGYEYRIVSYAQLVCVRPGHNGRMSLAV